jgi:hypothetical protein
MPEAPDTEGRELSHILTRLEFLRLKGLFES